MRKQKKRDIFVKNIFNQLDLPILHIRRWQSNELEAQIKETLGKNEKAEDK
ncbi:MAG: hypothetical protein LBC82_00775 [Oscillospiraceae bacterium]|nr:hypothetical protein [Oscillospiraceae bacterium]